ncbi:MAG: hypothetical protein GY935_05800 [Gammaproteobacteria bacterium]|nr:hypothetical protein [Gammaproteobacteria bacterium]
MKLLLSVLLSLAFSSSVQADLQMLVKDASGRTSTFSSNGQKARIDDKKMQGYVIVDYSSRELFMIDAKRNQILRTSTEESDEGEAGTALSVSLKDKGGGQKIAGFLTRKYELIADGESCGHVYASKELLRNKDVRGIFEAMRGLQRFSRSLTSGLGDLLPLCQRAVMQMSEAIETRGAPLRVNDNKGKLVSVVQSIDTDKKLAGNHYDLPDGMAVVDMGEQMNQAMEQTQKMMENMPDMSEIMKQMQQGDGQMSEQMQQQMEQLKKMMEQLQQQ